jgi:hypothetical protein
MQGTSQGNFFIKFDQIISEEKLLEQKVMTDTLMDLRIINDGQTVITKAHLSVIR